MNQVLTPGSQSHTDVAITFYCFRKIKSLTSCTLPIHNPLEIMTFQDQERNQMIVANMTMVAKDSCEVWNQGAYIEDLMAVDKLRQIERGRGDLVCSVC